MSFQAQTPNSRADYDFGQVHSSSPPFAALGASLVQSGGMSKRAAGIASVLMLTVSMLNAANCTNCEYGSGTLASVAAGLPGAAAPAVSCGSSAFFFLKRPPINDPIALPASLTSPIGLPLAAVSPPVESP